MSDEDRARDAINEAGLSFTKNELDEQERSFMRQIEEISREDPRAKEMEGWEGWESGAKQWTEQERARIKESAEEGLHSVRKIKKILRIPSFEDK